MTDERVKALEAVAEAARHRRARPLPGGGVMKPEQVPQEWVDWGKKAHTLFPRLPRIPMPPYPTSEDARELLIREILAAVAPIIAKQERERCARLAEDRHLGWVFPHPDDARPGEVCDDATACADIAAAIRALP